MLTFRTPLQECIPPVLALALGVLLSVASRAEEPARDPRPVPLTRPEMKQLIEDVKVRVPRIPLPELTTAQRQELGDDADSYESVLRHVYLPWEAERRRQRDSSRRGSRREQDPAMTLDYAFKTQLFWIVSRVNNCQYCIGHQESKLLSAGLSEDEIAALDGDWSAHTPAEQAAFSLARKLSYAPHEIGDADINALRPYFTDLQILEMVLSVSRNNISNRWKEGVAVPQRPDEGGYARSEDLTLPRGTYLTPTSKQYREVVTQVAPLVFDDQNQPTRHTLCRRPPLESRQEVDARLDEARRRTVRLPLTDEAKVRSVLSEQAPDGPVPQWMRLLAHFPEEGVRYASTIVSSREQGELSSLLKAQLSWIVARQDRAWYAVDDAHRRLLAAGHSDDQIAQLDGDWKQFTPRERALFTVARNLAASPVVLTDAEVAEAVEAAGARDVVQAISYTCAQGFFNRMTEAAGLPLEP